jgi:hypothetical protein
MWIIRQCRESAQIRSRYHSTPFRNLSGQTLTAASCYHFPLQAPDYCRPVHTNTLFPPYNSSVCIVAPGFWPWGIWPSFSTHLLHSDPSELPFNISHTFQIINYPHFVVFSRLLLPLFPHAQTKVSTISTCCSLTIWRLTATLVVVPHR